MTVLVDSDILIEVSRGKNAEVIAAWIELSSSEAAVLYSPVSVAELWAGARHSEHDALNNLFAGLACAPIDAEVGRQA
jgi:predicted nucleic acid-binding protein